jgi:hypothetical protein
MSLINSDEPGWVRAGIGHQRIIFSFLKYFFAAPDRLLALAHHVQAEI